MKVKQGHAESFNKYSLRVWAFRGPGDLIVNRQTLPAPGERGQGTGKTQVNMLDCSDGRTDAS